MENKYRLILEKNVIPKLISLGFEEVTLRHCARPEVLFRRGDLWFGTSWDQRDFDLTLNLGRLYWLQCVMPRVEVYGCYSGWQPTLKYGNRLQPQFLEQLAEMVASSLEMAVEEFSRKRTHDELPSFVIGPVKARELKKYLA